MMAVQIERSTVEAVLIWEAKRAFPQSGVEHFLMVKVKLE